MNPQKTGALIRQLRQRQNLTQAQLADQLGVSSKAVSKWERGAGCPDVASLNAIARVLGINVSELLSGEAVASTNRSGNLRRCRFYLCPVCGNVVVSASELFLSCCGLQMEPLEPQKDADPSHTPQLQEVEDEYYITLRHEMTKNHYLTFAAWVSSDRIQLLKLYPEQDAAFRMSLRGHGDLYVCCNRHGLYRIRL